MDASPESKRCPLCNQTRCQGCTYQIDGQPCGRRYCEHTPRVVCGGALEHADVHPDGITTDTEWDGRARMAACKIASGLQMTDVEAEAIRRAPNPTFLCGTCRAYHPRNRNCDTGEAA